MRTTIVLDDRLMRDVKARAAQRGTTVTALVDRALREMVARDAPPRAGYRLNMPTVNGSVRAGVDLTDRDRLHDVMDGRT